MGEQANTLRDLNLSIPAYPSPQPHVPLPLAMPLPDPPPPNTPAPAQLSTKELNTLQATIALTTARLVSTGTNYAHISDLVAKQELKLQKLKTRNQENAERFAEVVHTCQNLSAERGLLESMVKGTRDAAGAELQPFGGEGLGQEDMGGEVEGMVLEERAKEVIRWFGRQYPNVFGEDGGLKDALEGTGKVMQFAKQVLDEITKDVGGRPVDVEEKGKEKAEEGSKEEVKEEGTEEGEIEEGTEEVKAAAADVGGE